MNEDFVYFSIDLEYIIVFNWHVVEDDFFHSFPVCLRDNTELTYCNFSYW